MNNELKKLLDLLITGYKLKGKPTTNLSKNDQELFDDDIIMYKDYIFVVHSDGKVPYVRIAPMSIIKSMS